MDALTMHHAAAMPAPTWSWLKMNDAKIQIPADLELAGSIDIDAAEASLGAPGDFEAAVAALQERLDAAADPVARDRADARACVRAAREEDRAAAAAAGSGSAAGAAPGELGDLDTPALSAYQRRATRSEMARDVAADFETGIGHDARSYLNFVAGEPVCVRAPEGGRAEAAVRVAVSDGEACAASVDAVAEAGSTLSLSILLDGTEAAGAGSLAGSELRVFCGRDAEVDVTCYVLGGEGTVAIDDSGYVLDEGGRVRVRHVVLGGAATATGLAADVRGDGARIDVDTRYLAAGSDARDFNYIIRQRGRRTVSVMDAQGVLAGTSRKCLRGTIDLVHGCKGSEGTERETVLITNQGVDNKTVPTILCDEDDVAGNHGATIGHVRPDQMLYLACRGVSPEAAEALFMRAKLEDAALSAPDGRIREAVMRLGGRVIEGFTEDIEGELA